MGKGRLRLAIGVALVVVLGAVIAVLAGRLTSSREEHEGFAAKFEAAYLAGVPNEQREAGGETAEINGPVEQAALAHAYPADATPLAAIQGAQQAWAQASGRSSNSAGTWQLIGPSKATYPSVLTPFIMGGAQYVASGRTTALAIAPSCTQSRCRLYAGAAGGGVWRTDKALGGSNWEYVGGSLGTNAIGSLIVDPSDPSGNTVYVGTGESHASGDSEAGVGIYKTTNGGDTWSLVADSSKFFGRAISSLELAPDGTLYAGVARAVRGISSTTGGGSTNPPVAVPFGVYKLATGGSTFTSIWNGAGSIRGVARVLVDPTDPKVVYASAYQVGVYRTLDATAASPVFTQILAPVAPAFNTDRAEFAVTKLTNGNTRMYVGDGAQGAPPAQFFRTNDARAASPTFTNLTLSPPAGSNADVATQDYCSGQCWYDQFVYTPKGSPDVVYLGGSWAYGEVSGLSNGRGVVLSTDAGNTWSDVSRDAGPVGNADSLHPDQHALVTNPSDPLQWFEASDGGVTRVDGGYADASAQCDARGLSASATAKCKGLLWRVPKDIATLNDGLSTLQFQSLSVSAQRPLNLLMGGTQDNGTFEYHGSSVVWPQAIYGDGGVSGFSVTDDKLRFNTFFANYTDVNFRDGDPTKWVIVSGPLFAESSLFYKPIIADPVKGGTIFVGEQSVWRTTDWGGDRDFLEANCPEFTTAGDDPKCGDFVKLGTSTLVAASLGDRAGGNVAATERAAGDSSTLWAATTTGRVFISKNADAEPASAVTFTRLDSLASNDPGRYVSSIYVDPANANHAWVSYSGYNFNTPAQPGHVFEVTYNPVAGTATWTNLDGGTGPLGDLPVTDLVRDDVTGTLYAATDFGVLKLSGGSWVNAAAGLPMVETAGLTIVPGARVLYAATHGRGAWTLRLP